MINETNNTSTPTQPDEKDKSACDCEADLVDMPATYNPQTPSDGMRVGQGDAVNRTRVDKKGEESPIPPSKPRSFPKVPSLKMPQIPSFLKKKEGAPVKTTRASP